MNKGTIFHNLTLLLVAVLTFSGSAAAQKRHKQKQHQNGAHVSAGRPIMWEAVNIRARNLYDGPGGSGMRPDLSRIEFLKEEKDGHNKKFRIRDGSGKEWVAKLGREAQPETAAVRILWGIGYKTEINYLVPTLTIPRKGTFQNVRLEARPSNVERLGEWKWKSNPFVGTPQLQGLKMMMVFMTNWDVLDLQNKILRVGGEDQYIISDLGSTFGRLGNNNLPLFYRLGRKVNSPKSYIKTSFVKEVEDGEVKLAYKGKNRGLFRGFTVDQARWLARLLGRLSEQQIRDAFRAANYSDADVRTLTTAVNNKIRELENAVGGRNLAELR